MHYDKTKYKIWNWKNPLILHWIINPGLAINELFLGQVIPKVMLIEREGKQPYYQRTLVPCPHCGTIHSGLKWSSHNKTAFKNWFGYYCDSCKGIIPVQRNLTSLLILVLTYPFWGWFKDEIKQNWLSKQPKRYSELKLEVTAKAFTTKYFLKLGLLFGLFMFVSMVFVFPLIINEEITKKSILLGIPLWTISGLAWGYIMKVWVNRKGEETKAPDSV